MGNHYSTDDQIILCNSCENKLIVVTKRYNMTQHSNSMTHKENLLKFKSKTNTWDEPFIKTWFNKSSATSDKQSKFNKKLCNALVSANISLKKLNNWALKLFLKELTQFNIPDEWTLRKNDSYI